MKKIPTAEELKVNYKDYYILLTSNLLGEKFDIIRCVSTRVGHTQIIKADGSPHWFAASIQSCLDDGTLVQFSHQNYTKLHVEAALKAASESRAIELFNNTWYSYSFEPSTILSRINIKINKESILSAYPLTNIQ